jgi:hypothetical protein
VNDAMATTTITWLTHTAWQISLIRIARQSIEIPHHHKDGKIESLVAG